jgi:predicted nucleic acid-binding protein
MKKTKIYLDTSVISYLDQPERGEKYQDTHILWEQIRHGFYDVFISDVTADEISECKFEKRVRLWEYLHEISYTMLETNEKMQDMAREIVSKGILPPKSFDDSLHIAHAVVAECKNLLSWNFKHLVNVDTINGIREINLFEQYPEINILAPSMIIYRKGEQIWKSQS